jgi:hypothetical protein
MSTWGGLTEFLRARLDEDEVDMCSSLGSWHTVDCGVRLGYWADPDCVCDTPSRVLADIRAKRRMLTRKAARIECGSQHALLDVMDLLAPYADHPDYRPEWRP